jgi:hypothetical protein
VPMVAGFSMVPLTVTSSAFEAQVLCARLGADGIVTEMRGAYPLAGPVTVLVEAANAELARELMLADQVEAIFQQDGET